MKKAIKFLILILFSMASSYQASAQVGFSLGVKGGATFSSLYGQDADNVKRRTGWTGGLFMNLSILEVLSIQPEFLIQQKGATTTHSQDRNEIRLSYFQIPVLMKIRIPLGEHVYPNIFAGPSFSYRVDASYTATDTQTGTQHSVSVDNIKKSDTGGIIGAGLDLEGRHVFFTIDARYGVGFTNLGESTYSLQVKNNDFTVMAGIGFRVGGRKL